MSALDQILATYGLTGAETISLSEAGIDSLGIVELIDDFERASQVVSDEFIELLDTGALQDMSVVEVVRLVQALELGTDVDAIIGQLAATSQAHREFVDGCMRADAVLDPDLSFGAGGHAPPTARPQQILVTGATGFIGPFLIDALLRETQATLHCVVRGGDDDHAQRRLIDGIDAARLLTAELAHELERRVVVHAGDVATPQLGLAAAKWRSLADSIDTVVHNAAMVDYVRTYRTLKPHNVDGTANILRFCAQGRTKHLDYISSTIVFGWTPKIQLYESDQNANMENLDFGYAQSKWVAEQLVIDARRRGLATAIFRPSFLTASTTGVGSATDIVVRMLAFMVNRGLVPTAANQLSLLPVDAAARCMAAMIAEGRCAGHDFHVTVDDFYNLRDVTEKMTELYGFNFRYVRTPEFVAELRASCTRDDPMFPLLDFVARACDKLARMEAKRYDNRGYRHARDRAVPGYHDPTLDDTVRALVTHMTNDGLVAALVE